MKPTTSTPATMLAMAPARIESAPSSAPTDRSSITLSGAGSAPERSRIESSLALSTVKLPLMMPEPPRIGSRMFGAEITASSSTIANGLPTFSCVILPKVRAPALSKRKLTTGWLSWKLGCESVRLSPESSTFA
jgi:hypothetical protein